jgi:hypothetical protein
VIYRRLPDQLGNDPEIVFTIGDANSSGKEYYVHHIDEPDEPDDEESEPEEMMEMDSIYVWITEERGV